MYFRIDTMRNADIVMQKSIVQKKVKKHKQKKNENLQVFHRYWGYLKSFEQRIYHHDSI